MTYIQAPALRRRMPATTMYEAVVRAGFQVFAMEESPYSASFYVGAENTKDKFLSLYDAIKGTGRIPVFRRRGDEAVLSIVRAELQVAPRKDIHLVLGSLLLTAMTISLDFLIRYPLIREIESAAGAESPFLVGFATYVLGFLLVFGFHELGHKLSSIRNGVETSGPYFIPGIPGIYPTLGAVILQRGIPKNRDELIDIGISGPLTGFVTAVVLATLAIMTGVYMPMERAIEISQETGVPLSGMQPIMQLLEMVLPNRGGENMALFLGALGTPVWLAFVLTFVNLFPAGQLDGGHVARGALGPEGHRILTILSIVGLILAQFWLMAIFAALTWGFKDHPGPLDDVSGLSLATKVKVLLGVVVLILCFSAI